MNYARKGQSSELQICQLVYKQTIPNHPHKFTITSSIHMSRLIKPSRPQLDSSKDDQEDIPTQKDPFSQDDFQIQLPFSNNLGKRTGKRYEPSKWKKSPEGFYDFELESNDSLTPPAKLNKIKQKLGILDSQSSFEEEHFSKQSPLVSNNQKNKIDNNKNTASFENKRQNQNNKQKESDQKQRIPKSNNMEKLIDKKKQKQNVRQTRFSRKTDFQFSFQFQLDEDLFSQSQEESETSSPQFQTCNQETKQTNQQKINNQQNARKKSSSNERSQTRQFLQVENKQQKQINANPKITRSSLQRKNQTIIASNNKLEEKPSTKLKSSKQDKKITRKSSQKIKTKKPKNPKKNNKGGKNRLLKKQNPKKQNQDIQPSASLESMASDLEQQNSHNNYFEQVSEIQLSKNMNTSLIKDNSLKSILVELQNPTNEQTGELNRAIINTQSEYSLKTGQSEYEKEQFQQKDFRKNKSNNSQQRQRQNDLNFKQISKESQGTRRNRSHKQNIFLSESLKKRALEYHEQELRLAKLEQQRKQKQNEEIQLKKNKRQRPFTLVETSDILDQEKLEELKENAQKKRPAKKLKVNPDHKTQSSSSIFSNFRPNQKRVPSQQNQFPFENTNQNSLESSESKQQKVKVNSKIIKEIDKGLKRKQRPERVTPLSKSKQLESSKGEKIRKAQSLQNQIADKSREQKQITELLSKHKYPKRNRCERLQFWKGEKIVYDFDGKAKTIETKQLFRLIGFIHETFGGELILEPTMSKDDRYFQDVTLNNNQLMDFLGFDERYSELQIDLKKGKKNHEKYRKHIEVYQEGELRNLKESISIKPNTGCFTVQNIGNDVVSLEFILVKNMNYKL